MTTPRSAVRSSPLLAAIFVAVIVLALVIAATACGSPVGAPAGSAPPATMSAEQVVQGLVAKVPTARAAEVFTADTDPNHLLGRPGGYTSKAAVTDTRVDPAQAPGSESIDRVPSDQVLICSGVTEPAQRTCVDAGSLGSCE